jgi:NHLM bacteriocin system ABC transporter, peptidase/ATP-binding protein
MTIREPITSGIAKVPVVIQLEALECGAAALTMILAYYGKWIPLEEVRKDCGVSRDGSKAKNILKAARNYGLNAKGYRYEPHTLRREGKFPCIIHWNMTHFVVLCGFKGNKAIINDPARGRMAVSKDIFCKSFTGICLMFEPGESFEPSGRQKSILEFSKEKLSGTGAAFALQVITTVIISLIGIITPAFANVFADRLLTGENPEWFYPFIIGLSAIAALQIVVSWIQTIYSLKSDGKIAVTSNADFMWHVLRLPVEFFSQRMSGDIISRKALNGQVSSVLVNSYAPLLIQGFMMIFYLAVMMRFSKLMALIGVLSVILNLYVTSLIAAKCLNITRVNARDIGKLTSATVTGIKMVESIKATGAENGFFETWAGYQANANSDQVEFTKANTYLGLIPKIVTVLTNAVIFAGSVYLCMNGQWTIGMITAFSQFLAAFLAPASTLVTASQSFQEMRSSMERIEDVMKYPVDPACERENAVPDGGYDKLRGKVELRNVTFGYSHLEEPLIKDFSLTIMPGQSLAFVGPTGCGKSTLSKLISGLYEPWSGEILFDDIPINQINRHIFTSSVAVVDQDIILFEDTIENNIKMWDKSIENYEMIMAAHDAQIHDVIMEHSGGYQFRLGEDGKGMSGGERQRLEIARVLAQEPTVIILDEATSALDAKTEFDVVKAIKDRGITCIIIAHRLSTIRDSNQIIVLDNGADIERGTHDELYHSGGMYSSLISN